eukprot:SAG31_NODE_2979_length_4829_cov_6.315645_2_plen_93_part_00
MPEGKSLAASSGLACDRAAGSSAGCGEVTVVVVVSVAAPAEVVTVVVTVGIGQGFAFRLVFRRVMNGSNLSRDAMFLQCARRVARSASCFTE